jgi:hypothetical protein
MQGATALGVDFHLDQAWLRRLSQDGRERLSIAHPLMGQSERLNQFSQIRRHRSAPVAHQIGQIALGQVVENPPATIIDDDQRTLQLLD